MRFRVRCTNPTNGRQHELELEGGSLHDVQRALRDTGLEITQITPIQPAPRARKRLRIPRPRRRVTGETPARDSRPFSKRPVAKRLFAYLTILVVGAAIAGTALLGRGEDPEPLLRLQASVRFDGNAFRVVNRDESAWRDVCIDINGGLMNRGYMLELSTFGSGQVMTFPSAAFRDEGGRRFDPQDEKLGHFRITARIGERKAMYSRRWD